MKSRPPGKGKSKGPRSRAIKVDALARVEGEGGLFVKIEGGEVKEVKLRIFEPPRLFEAFLRGRNYSEAPDITARICGICPIAYQMSSIQAMEEIFGLKVEGALRDLRRLIYCGEWIESHALHVFMLHAPDFLGYESALHMGRDHPDAVAKGLRIKKAGNEIMTVIGGREIHPINMRVGGFYRTPSRGELTHFIDELKWCIDAAEETVRWTSSLSMPDLEEDYEFVALRHPSEYPIHEGRLVSSKGLDIPISGFHDAIEEFQVKHSTSLHSRVRARGAYHVGPLARFALNFDLLTPRAKEAARAAGLVPPVRNPFRSIAVRAVELVFACEEALRLIEGYREPDSPCLEYKVRAGVGQGCTEAPRGICHHRYKVDDKGTILEARIAPPTAQNQMVMESDIAHLVSKNLDLEDEKLQWRCEQALRNYDPCISCSCHALKVRVERS
jgi:sulfhydrogenase subunit alpha